MRKAYVIAAVVFIIPFTLVALSLHNGISPSKKRLNLIKHAQLEHRPIVFKIEGKSKNLSPKTLEKMNKWRQEVDYIALQKSQEVFINGQTNRKLIALTFDDGPDGLITPKILDILKEHKIRASFFFIGNSVLRYPWIVKRTYLDGNLVLNHSFTHSDLATKNIGVIRKEIQETDNVIYKLIGKKPALLRPPYGAINDTVINEAENNNDKIILWSTDTLDWSQKEKRNIIKNVLDNLRPGEIILMHSNEDKNATAEALPIIITDLQRQGYQFVTLAELLKVKPYK